MSGRSSSVDTVISYIREHLNLNTRVYRCLSVFIETPVFIGVYRGMQSLRDMRKTVGRFKPTREKIIQT